MSLRAIFAAAAFPLFAASSAVAQAPAAAPEETAQPPSQDDSEPAAQNDQPKERLVYSVDRMPERAFDVARDVTVITGDELRRKNARTLPEALMGEPGVFMQQTDYGAGSPILRGLIGKQILLLVDGVRVNNATYRFGANQYLATIDLSNVERVEIVKGVGSVLGSDALGGMINVITKKGPPASRDGVGAATAWRYGSADASVVGVVEAYGAAAAGRGIAGGTFRTTDDVKVGDGITQPATGNYDERAAFARLEWFATDSVSVAASYQALQQNDVPRTDKYTDGTNLQYLYGPQRFQLGSLVVADQTSRAWSDRSQVTVYWNRQDEAVDEIRTSAPTVQRQLRDSDTLAGLTAETSVFIGKSNQLVYGLDASRDWVGSRRNDLNLTTLVLSPKQSRFADGSTYDMAAVYAQDRVSLGKWLTLTVGARFSYFGAAGALDTKIGAIDIGFGDTALTGTASAVVHVLPNVNVVASVTPGFRAPNIDDVSTWDERSNGVEVPSPDVSPERILNYEAGVKYHDERGSGALFGYYAKLTDLLVRTNGTYLGQDWVDLNGNLTRDANETVFQKKNIGEATVWGAGAQVRYRVVPTVTAFGNATFTRGTNDLTDDPLDKIPPLFGAVGATWMPRVRYAPWAEVAFLFAGRQPPSQLSPGDIADSRIGPDGTDAWQDLSIRAGATVAGKVRVSAAVENIFDAQYKYHGSGVYRPGRQFVGGLELRY